jgi:hypothetical protein
MDPDLWIKSGQLWIKSGQFWIKSGLLGRRKVSSDQGFTWKEEKEVTLGTFY